MKKLLALALAGAMAISLAACASAPASSSSESSSSSSEESEAESSASEEASSEESESEATTVTVTVLDAEGNDIDVEFPVAPEKVVVLNWQTMDFLDAVGMGDSVVGLIKSGSYPEHLQKYVDDESIVNVGGMKDVDMEAVMSLEPDVIFSSDRTESQYEEFSMIAPTMSAAVVYEDGFMNSYKELAAKHGQIFGITDEVDGIISDYEARIQAIADFAGEQTASLLIFAGGLNALGDNGRCSIIVNEMGFSNVKADEDVNHGDAITYDGLLTLNPDWFFVLDKDNAVGEEATAAKEQMENEIIMQTSAYQNDQIVYLEPGSSWYLCDGGITAMDQMITNIEQGVGLK